MNPTIRRICIAGLAIAWLMPSSVALAAPVDVQEAVAVAQAWLASEVEHPLRARGTQEQTVNVPDLKRPLVTYIGADGQWLDTPPEEVLGYIVSFPTAGFVLLTADDRLDAVLVFSATDRFKAIETPANYLREYVANDMPGRWQALRAQLDQGVTVPEHPQWSWVRAALAAGRGLDLGGSRTNPLTSILWSTPLWDQFDPYNDLCVTRNGGYEVPTGCTATAMSIKMRFHSWPPTGAGSHSYQDNHGNIQYYHSVNFGASTYNWANMPWGNVTQPNADVAQIMYHSGVAVGMDYEVGGSAAWPRSAAMNNYFRYRETTEIWSSNPADHQAAIITSVFAALPVVLSTNLHTVVAAGYRQSPSPYFFLNIGYSGYNNGWYNLDGIPPDGETIQESLPYCQPSNYVYVDGAASGSQTGALLSPYHTILAGGNAVPSGGCVFIRTGSYTGAGNSPISISQPMWLYSYEGEVTIGADLRDMGGAQ